MAAIFVNYRNGVHAATVGLRLRLVAYRDGTVTDAGAVIENQARGISNKLPSLAWGDPRVS